MKKFLGVLLVGLLVLGGLAGCARAEFEVRPLTITPGQIVAGESFTASTEITNVGGAEGTYVATLTMDGNITDTKEVTVAAGATEIVSFTCDVETPGTHSLELNGLSTTVTALKPAEFEVVSLTVPAEVVKGEVVTITADITNAGEVEGTYEASLKINAVEVDTKDVVVAAGDTETISFELAEDVPGMYTIDLEGLTSTFRVLKPAEFRIGSLDITPNPVKVGQETIVGTSIENMGEAEGTYTASLVVDGLVEETKDIRLTGGTTESVSFTISKDSPGSYSVQIADQEAILKVIEPVRLPTGSYIVRELTGGRARLEVENGLDLDAVVVLSSSAEPSIPLVAVYIQSGDSFTVRKIERGTYVLYFSLGEYWDNDSKKFIGETIYQQFEDEFDFVSSSRRYTIWTVTLHPVVGGAAGTEFLSEDEFPGLE